MIQFHNDSDNNLKYTITVDDNDDNKIFEGILEVMDYDDTDTGVDADTDTNVDADTDSNSDSDTDAGQILIPMPILMPMPMTNIRKTSTPPDTFYPIHPTLYHPPYSISHIPLYITNPTLFRQSQSQLSHQSQSQSIPPILLYPIQDIQT